MLARIRWSEGVQQHEDDIAGERPYGRGMCDMQVSRVLLIARFGGQSPPSKVGWWMHASGGTSKRALDAHCILRSHLTGCINGMYIYEDNNGLEMPIMEGEWKKIAFQCFVSCSSVSMLGCLWL